MRPSLQESIDSFTGKGIRLEGMKINDGELADIVEYIIKTHQQIEQLGFPRNNITDNGCAILAEKLVPLVKDHNLTYINLESNAIGEEGSTALCNGLMSINSNFSIAFRGNKLKDVNKMDDIEARARANAEKPTTNKPNRAKC